MKLTSKLLPFQISISWRLAGLLTLTLFNQTAFGETSPAPKPDLVGQVQTKEGTAVKGVTVFIDTAGPKVGTSPFCPSCYADCRKSAKTDGQGNFKIESLDPQLLFRILIAGKGYQPKYISKVDPAKGPMKAELEPFDASKAPPENSLHGRVIDTKGKPIEGAVVESHGIRRGSGTMWGSLPGVDPLAVTDERGEFVITAKEPFEAMDVIVEARTFAKKTFTGLARGTERHQLRLTEGATVSGRVVQNGKPLPNVSVGMVSTDRGMENFTGNFELGTDADGRFAFVNLPPNVRYYIYGIMGTIKPYGAIAITEVTTGKDGETLNVGDLTVGPAHRLAGKAVLSDGKSVPPKTRLMVNREKAWDSMLVELDKNGEFDVTGIPTESLGLIIQVNGYGVSGKNASLDTMNPFGLVGRVDNDITNLVILMQKGKSLEPDYNSSLPMSEYPANKPLRGAEASADHSNQFEVSGHVLDDKTKQPVSRFRITPGNTFDQRPELNWDARHQIDGTNGSYTAYFQKGRAEPTLKVEAEGYLPMVSPALANGQTNYDFSLKKGSGPNGKVLLPNGEAAAGVTVVLLCAREQISLDEKGSLSSWRNKKLQKITDSEGAFSFAPELNMISVAAAGPDAFKVVSVDLLAANTNIVLDAYGKIKGTLKRPAGTGSNEGLDIAFDAPYSLQRAYINLQCHAVTDAEGRFEFVHVPAGKLQISYRIKMEGANGAWRNEPLQQVVLKPEETLEVNIKAPEKKLALDSLLRN
jgi:uncharacterized GH25 family protein